MRTPACVSVLAVVLGLASPAAASCDPPAIADLVARAERAERQHALGRALTLRTELLGCPSGPHAAPNRAALSQAYASLGDYARAADFAESVAPLATERAQAVTAMHTAIGYRVALQEPRQAQADVLWLLTATKESEAALARAFEAGEALEARHMWTEATAWYQHLATRFTTRFQWQIRARAYTKLGRAYAALGNLARAQQSWKLAVVQGRTAHALGAIDIELHIPRRPTPPVLPPPRRPRRPRPEARSARASNHIVSPFGGMTESGTSDTNSDGYMPDMNAPRDFAREALAEALFRLTSQVATECGRVPLPSPEGPTREDYDRWAVEVVTPWIQFREQCLEVAQRHFVEVIGLHVVPWQLAAAARIAEENWFLARDIRSSPRRPGYNPDLMGAWNLMW